MDEKKKNDIKELVTILLELDGTSLFLMRNTANTLKLRQDLEREKQTA